MLKPYRSICFTPYCTVMCARLLVNTDMLLCSPGNSFERQTCETVCFRFDRFELSDC